MILPISCFGSPILRAKTKNVSFDQTTKDLIQNMWETMYNANGVGLAAPQVNKDLRLFIIDTSSFQDDNDFPNHIPLKEVFINPIIKNEEGERWEFNEGCLSIPDIREHVKRNSVIHIDFYDENFKLKSKKYTGINARVIQHEYDHLNGVLFIDKISVLKKRMINRKLKDITKGKFTTSYKMRLFK